MGNVPIYTLAECPPEWKDGRRIMARFKDYWQEVTWGPKGLKWMHDRGGFYLADKATHVTLPPPYQTSERELEHAAEVARCRADLDKYGQHYLSCPQSKLKPWEDKRRGCTCGFDAALAAPPTAAAQAVEALRKAAHDVLKEYDASPEGRISTWGLRTALAAWKEATRG